METTVLIAGGGPIGLTIAMDLAMRGIDVVLCEKRAAGEPPSVKCNHVAARSMEYFRDLGIAGTIRDAGLPHDYPHDAVYRTTVTGQELTRIFIPSRNERRTTMKGPDTDWPTPEPPHRINQIYLEPILFRHALGLGRIRILSRTEITGFAQADDCVRATARDLDGGREIAIEAAYLIGCDGGSSMVRKSIGAKFRGTPIVQRAQSTLIRAPQLLGMIPGRPGWMNLSLNPRRSGNTIAIDGKELWLIHNYLYEDETDFGAIDRDASIRTILGVGGDFRYEVVSQEDWLGRRLVADKFRDRRVFLCGDAAHIWVPYAGFGMNAGLADAANLAWMLAAHLNGWAPAAILDAHEKERLPITEQVSHYAMNHALAAIRHRRDTPQDIEAEGPDGEKRRREFGQEVYDLNVQQYCCGGLNFGYFYDRSPLIAYDGEAAPGYQMASFTPSTVPGCRTPYFKLADDVPLYDRLGRDFALIRLDPSLDVEPLLNAARHRRVPIALVDAAADSAPDAYRHKLALSRPDRHVAWRGDRVPPDPLALVDQIRGAA